MFSTKARTLAQLLGVLQSAKIVPLIYFTVAQWRESSENCIKSIIQQLAGDAWIVRSSCKQEDCFNQSSAGVFLSLQNVNISGLDSAITQVLSSYLETVDLDEVLVQPMLQHVIRSGVAFSHDPSTGEPYRMINWSEGEDTAVITGGGDGCIWRQAACYCSDDIPKEIFAIVKDKKIIIGNILAEIHPIVYRFNKTYLSNQTYFLLYTNPEKGNIFKINFIRYSVVG